MKKWKLCFSEGDTMILNFYGPSNSGKTQLVEKLIAALREKDYSVGTIKNIHVENFSIDTEGKDTWRHHKAGAEMVVANSEDEVAFLVKYGMVPEEVKYIIYKATDPDIVIIEGYWADESQKITVGEMEERPNTVMRYKDNFDEILTFAVEGIETEKIVEELPGLDCGKCGKDTCTELARSIRENSNTFEDCEYYSEKKVTLKVDGKEVPLGKFAKDIVAGTVSGMVSTLKGVEGGREITVEITV
jgi:molybdopterin-guanine dinucleotide biosynthesis protein B